MKIILIGANGTIGAQVQKALAGAGHEMQFSLGSKLMGQINLVQGRSRSSRKKDPSL